MQLSNDILDNFGAPKLSELTECGAPLLDEPPDYLWAFALHGAINGIIQHHEPWVRNVLMFGRRVELAIREYRTGRDHLNAYVHRLPDNDSADFLIAMRATTHFEQCVAATCQAKALIDRYFATLLETRVFGRDQSVRGLLRVTLAPILATHLLMPDFADFSRLHPEVEMEILSIEEPVNLTNREADVAIRVVYERSALPLNLHGLKGPELFGAVYMSRDLLAAWRAGAPDRIRWIVTGGYDSDWAHVGEVRATEVPFRTTDTAAQIVAVRHGLGMTTLPCFVGDSDPLLVRVPGSAMHRHGTLWLLAQDQAGAALHGVRVPQARRVRAAARGTVLFQRLTRGRSPTTLAVPPIGWCSPRRSGWTSERAACERVQ
jgi:DNA-binding transcriptional LysR family regulator